MFVNLVDRKYSYKANVMVLRPFQSNSIYIFLYLCHLCLFINICKHTDGGY